MGWGQGQDRTGQDRTKQAQRERERETRCKFHLPCITCNGGNISLSSLVLDRPVMVPSVGSCKKFCHWCLQTRMGIHSFYWICAITEAEINIHVHHSIEKRACKENMLQPNPFWGHSSIEHTGHAEPWSIHMYKGWFKKLDIVWLLYLYSEPLLWWLSRHDCEECRSCSVNVYVCMVCCWCLYYLCPLILIHHTY